MQVQCNGKGDTLQILLAELQKLAWSSWQELGVLISATRVKQVDGIGRAAKRENGRHAALTP